MPDKQTSPAMGHQGLRLKMLKKATDLAVRRMGPSSLDWVVRCNFVVRKMGQSLLDSAVRWAHLSSLDSVRARHPSLDSVLRWMGHSLLDSAVNWARPSLYSVLRRMGGVLGSKPCVDVCEQGLLHLHWTSWWPLLQLFRV